MHPVKNVEQWVNNDVKHPSQFTTVTKQKDVWGVPEYTPQTYFYNDVDIPYNSNLFEYNFIVDNNTINQKLVTKWSHS